MPKCEITLWHGCSPVSLLHIFTVFFLFLRKITIETNLTNFAGVIIFWMVDAFTAYLAYCFRAAIALSNINSRFLRYFLTIFKI